MKFVYSFCNGNGRAAVVEYQQWYPLRIIPHKKTFGNVHRTLRETGSFPRANAECEFCEWLQPRLHILRDILFRDMAQFSGYGITNTRNFQSWAYENPHEVEDCHYQRRFSVNVSYGVLGNKMIVPHVIERRLRALCDRNFQENKLPLHLEDMPLVTRRRMWLQIDGASPHFGRGVAEFWTKIMKEDGKGEVDRWLGPLGLPT
jgi:hypothetical protein